LASYQNKAAGYGSRHNPTPPVPMASIPEIPLAQLWLSNLLGSFPGTPKRFPICTDDLRIARLHTIVPNFCCASLIQKKGGRPHS